MELSKKKINYKILKFKQISAIGATIAVHEFKKKSKFCIKRIYFFSKNSKLSSRGNHSQKKNCCIIVVNSGKFKILLKYEKSIKKFIINANSENCAVYIANKVWRKITPLTKNSSCLVLNTKNYNQNDYIF